MPANDLPRSKFSATHIIAVLGVLALHGLATWGLANAASPKLLEPKIEKIKPIEIQLVTPIEEKPPEVVEIKKIEPPPIKDTPEPKPKPKPVVAPKSEPKPKPVVAPKSITKLKPKSAAKPKPPVAPKLTSIPKVVQATNPATDNSFALEQQHQADLDKQRQAELEKQRQADLDKQRQADLEKQRQADLAKQRQADLEKQRQADLEKQRQADLEKQRQADLDKQRQVELEKQRQAVSNTPVNFSAGQASWKREPNLLFLEKLKHDDKLGAVITVRVTMTVDSEGNVIQATLVNRSGNRAIDNGIKRAVKASKLYPFTQNGAKVFGTVTLPIKHINSSP